MWVILGPIPTKREGDAHGSPFERKILVKSPKPGNRVQKMVEYKNYHAQLWREIMSGNYEWKLSASILSREKCEIYRRIQKFSIIFKLLNFATDKVYF